MGNRYWIMQLIDAWNNVPHAPGSRTVGGKGGNFAIVGPGWKGTLPAGLTELRVPTTLAMIGGRTYTGGKDDYAAVHALQDQYTLVPLSDWGKNYTPPDNVPLKPGVDSKTPVPKQVLAMTPESFFNRLNALLVTNPPEPADPATMARIAKLGIRPGAEFLLSAFSPEVRKAIEDGVADGQKLMRETPHGKDVNGWEIMLDMGHYGTNYAYRAYWTFYGVGGNLAEDAVYPFTAKDAEGKLLDGANKYVLHFTKKQIPPVNAFWSVTLYDNGSYLVPNPINRYALGDRGGMKFGDDGSLTIYIQNNSPGKDKEANWLPSPKKGGAKAGDAPLRAEEAGSRRHVGAAGGAESTGLLALAFTLGIVTSRIVKRIPPPGDPRRYLWAQVGERAQPVLPERRREVLLVAALTHDTPVVLKIVLAGVVGPISLARIGGLRRKPEDSLRCRVPKDDLPIRSRRDDGVARSPHPGLQIQRVAHVCTGPGAQRACTSDLNPTRLWLPSQKGLFAECPQRQR